MREILPKVTEPFQPIKNPMAKQRRKASATTKAPPKQTPYRKKKITGALREAVWMKTMGRTFEGKCPVSWCSNTITVFDFQSGHNIPESKGGETKLPNLIPICARCNFSMGNTYTIDEWNALHAMPEAVEAKQQPHQAQQQQQQPRSFWKRMVSCFLAH